MSSKSAHADDASNQSITGSSRKHILSRLQRASRHATELVALLHDKAISRASNIDLLEAEAYARCMSGSHEFEKHFSRRYDSVEEQKTGWSQCLTVFSEAHVIYSSLLYSTKREVFKSALASDVDPSIRYAAYQSRIPRSLQTAAIAKQYFRRSEGELPENVMALNPEALDEKSRSAAEAKDPDGDAMLLDIPTSLVWRGRTAPITDAAIGQGVASRDLAAAQLKDTFLKASTELANATDLPAAANTQKNFAASYDAILTAAQDTVDAVRSALADVAKEGIPESDSRMQDLRVCDLSANYSLISYRVGRNRVLISSLPQKSQSNATQQHNVHPEYFDDGLHFHATPPPPPRLRRAESEKAQHTSKPAKAAQSKPESTPHKLARLQTRIALYDSVLQSTASLRTLPGAARDAAFVEELEAQEAYFRALRCLNVAYSYSVLAKEREALALFARAEEHVLDIDPDSLGSTSTQKPNDVPTLAVTRTQFSALQAHLAHQVLRQRGLVTLRQSIPPLYPSTSLRRQEDSYQNKDKAVKPPPLVDDLSTYPDPSGGVVDLKNLVRYPPALEPVPVKPIFLDLAFNFIEYPGRRREGDGKGAAMLDGAGEQVKKEEKKRGWFGFGR